MKKTVMRSYAKLIVRVGANVQKGQEVRVFASLDQHQDARRRVLQGRCEPRDR